MKSAATSTKPTSSKRVAISADKSSSDLSEIEDDDEVRRAFAWRC